MSAFIVSTGHYLPQTAVSNEDLSHFPKASLKLIEEKTGILSRHRCGPAEATSTLAIEAARRCLGEVGFDPARVDAVVLATSTPDRTIPATATKVAHAIGAENAFAFDLNSVCSGSVFALEVARGLIVSGSARHVLCIAADAYSKILNPADFSTFPYFGDGAGAVLLSRERTGAELLAACLHSDGAGYETITVKAGGSEQPITEQTRPAERYFTMKGRDVFAFAVQQGEAVLREILQRHDIPKESVATFILHQANINILRKIAENLGVEMERFFCNLPRIGNTAGGSVLIALDETLRARAGTATGNTLALASFGGGLSWGACAIRLEG